jgi:hypothetical protein
MTKMNWFYKNQVAFEWKYWMTLHAFWIKFELNSNWIQIPKFNSNTQNGIPIPIQQLKLRLNWIQIGGEGMENLLVNMVLEKKSL